MEIKSCDINFIEIQFTSISDTKGDFDLYELEDITDDEPSFSEGGGEDTYSTTNNCQKWYQSLTEWEYTARR